MHAGLAKSDITTKGKQVFDFRNSIDNNFLSDRELAHIVDALGFQSIEEYEVYQNSFDKAMLTLIEEFPDIYEEVNREVFSAAYSNIISNMKIKLMDDDLSLRNEEPSEYTLRLDLVQCKFPQIPTQEGTAFACNGWEANNCQEYWNECVHNEQLEYIISTFSTCTESSDLVREDFWT